MSTLKEFKQLAVTHNANRHLELYLKTGDEFLIWRAYQEFRKEGLEIPESLLKKLDEFAEDSIESTNSNAISKEEQRDIVEFMYHLKTYSNKTPTEINAEASNKFSRTIGTVKNIYTKWVKEDGEIKSAKAMKDFHFKP